MVSKALSKAVFGVGVGRAVDGGPQLVVGRVVGDHVLGGIQWGAGGGFSGDSEERESCVVYFWSGGFGGERDYFPVIFVVGVGVVVGLVAGGEGLFVFVGDIGGVGFEEIHGGCGNGGGERKTLGCEIRVRLTMK